MITMIIAPFLIAALGVVAIGVEVYLRIRDKRRAPPETGGRSLVCLASKKLPIRLC